MTTAIQWTDETWNPVTGCRKVSPGCKHCYAEGVADRFWASQYPPVEDTFSARPRRFTDVQVHPDRLEQPLSWRKPRRVFVNSMSDLFHEDVPDEFIEDVFGVMARAQRHTFQVLTKRPERMRDWFDHRLREGWVHWAPVMDRVPGCERMAAEDWPGWPLPNVWLGVSVEDQQRADERIPLLLDTPAVCRFLSCEPLLEAVNLRQIELIAPEVHGTAPNRVVMPGAYLDALTGHVAGPDDVLPAVDWVIVGGESGPQARPMDLAWARSLVEQGHAAGVPVFVKQLGRRPARRIGGTDQHGPELIDLPRFRDNHGGDWDEWPADLRVREFPA
ncbi:MAG: DUF5131 family protein [Thermoleophilia bacterium]